MYKINGIFFPVTYEIIGCGNKMLGVKVGLYNINNRKEFGFFLTVDEWGWIFENKILK
jgi:hypothetical protein